MGREAPAEAAPWNVQALPAPKGVISVGGEMLAEAPAWAVFGVVTNYAKLPRLGGRLEMCEVLESLDDCTTKIKQHHRINIFGAFKGLFESIYVAKTMEDASTLRLDVKLLESNLMRAHEYEMRVVPVDQRKSKLFYKNTFQPKRMPPIEPARKLLCKQAKGDVKQLFQNIRTLLKTSDT